MNKVTKKDIKEIYEVALKVLDHKITEGCQLNIVDRQNRWYGQIRANQKMNPFTKEVSIVSYPRISFNLKNINDYEKHKYANAYEAAIDTIAHELAHTHHFNHGTAFKALNRSWTNQLKIALGYEDTEFDIEEPVPTLIKVEDNLITLAEACSMVGIEPKKVRVKLRKAGIEKPGTRWEWTNGIPKEVRNIIEGMRK